jgi:hypothetical protein
MLPIGTRSYGFHTTLATRGRGGLVSDSSTLAPEPPDEPAGKRARPENTDDGETVEIPKGVDIQRLITNAEGDAIPSVWTRIRRWFGG